MSEIEAVGTAAKLLAMTDSTRFALQRVKVEDRHCHYL
jgi:hypothetical protein